MSKTRNFPTDRIFLIASLAAVLIAVVTGFWLLGSPGQQRLIALDDRRIQDLSSIASMVSDQLRPLGNEAAKPLPAQLPESVSKILVDGDSLATDPVTNQPYEYRKLSDDAYELCATFATDSSKQVNNSWLASTWPHPQGRHCFEIEKLAAQPKL